MNGAPPCSLDTRCGCTLLYLPNPLDFTATYRHGENPEHQRTFRDYELRESDICANGHPIVIEGWLQAVVDRCAPPLAG